MRCLLFFFAHQDLQHHRNMIKAVKMTPMARPSKRRLAGRSNQIKARIAVGGELEAQALLESEATASHSESIAVWRFPTMKMKAM